MHHGERKDNSLLTRGERHSLSLFCALHFPTQKHKTESTQGSHTVHQPRGFILSILLCPIAIHLTSLSKLYNKNE